jgi:putative drug exporter of the RND superfamily
LRRIASFVAGRRTKWLVLLFWIVIGAFVAPVASKLEKAEKNESSSYLPGSAESTKVLDIEKKLQGGNIASAVVVYSRSDGLTSADVAEASSDYCALQQLHLKGELAPPPGPCPPPPGQTAQNGSQWQPPSLSPDGKALIYGIPIASDVNAKRLIDGVASIRDRVGEGSGGLVIRVTGGAGFTADAVKVFSDINTKLLLGTIIIVGFLLLFSYRSPFLWLVPLLTVAFAEQATRAMAYGLAKSGVVINGQTAGVLTVLVFGAGTDYALLIVARFREELRRHEDKHEAMQLAWRRVAPAILASSMTVIAGLLCLTLATLNSNKGLGPVSALGIALTVFAMLTLFPALLTIFARGVFWPYVPRFGSEPREREGTWARIGQRISHRPRIVWITTAVVLAVLSLGVLKLNTNLSQLNGFRGSVQSVQGQDIVAAHFPAGFTATTDIVVKPSSELSAAIDAAGSTEGVAKVLPPLTRPDLAAFSVVLNSDPYGKDAFRTVDALRERVHRAAPGALVGGATAIQLDANNAASHDFRLIAPIILLVVLLILAGLLRAVVAPLLLVATVILSFGAAFGASILAFEYIFKFKGMDPSLQLLAFVFLVALGVDYNIFLMARVREETHLVGTHDGVLRGLAVTGAVITSAGIVLAGTFSVLGILPLVALTELGFIVAFGVLLDTLIVRSILVPALSLDVGPRMWWPSRLWRDEVEGRAPARELTTVS